MLDIIRLEKVRHSAGKTTARCPVCAENGSDRVGNHLLIRDDGRFACIAHPGAAGDLHRKRIWELVGIREDKPLTPLPRPRPKPAPAPKSEPTWNEFLCRRSSLRPLTWEETDRIATVRGWHFTRGMALLVERGLMWYGEVFDKGRTWPAWIATDTSRRNADARRFDGEEWAGIEAKAKSLTKGARGWPIGCDAIGARKNVVLCEGVPDFAAALIVAYMEGIEVDRLAPCCMTGASNDIDPAALHYFAGKRIRIAVHDDDAGRAAAHRWADQLYRADAERVDGFDFAGMTKRDGEPVKDLADFATLLDGERDEAPRMFRQWEGLE